MKKTLIFLVVGIFLLSLASASINYVVNGETVYTINQSTYLTHNLSANYFIGDGSLLTNIPSSSSNRLDSNDGYKTLLLTNNLLQYWDGTRDRADFSAVHTKFFSPDGAYTLLDNNRYVYNDGTRNREEINAFGRMSISPSGTKTLLLNNSGVFADGSKVATVNDISPNWDTAYGWGDHDGLYSLLNHKEDTLYSSNSLVNFTLTNTDGIFRYNGDIRFKIDANYVNLYSPNGDNFNVGSDIIFNGKRVLTTEDLPVSSVVSNNGLSNISVNNSGTYITGNFTVGDEYILIDENIVLFQSTQKNHNLIVGNDAVTVDGGQIFTASNTLSQISDVSPSLADGNILVWNATSSMWENRSLDRIISLDGLKNLTIDNDNLIYNDGTINRILIDTGKTGFYAPDGSYAYLMDGVFVVHDGTRNRFLTSPTNTIFYGADGTKTLTLDNSGLDIIGDTTITGLTTLIGDSVNFKMKAKTVGEKSVIGWYKSDDTRIGWIGHGSSANYDLTIRNEGTDGNIQLIADSGIVYVNDYLKVSTLTGTGNDYVCVDSTGQMFRSSSGC